MYKNSEDELQQCFPITYPSSSSGNLGFLEQRGRLELLMINTCFNHIINRTVTINMICQNFLSKFSNEFEKAENVINFKNNLLQTLYKVYIYPVVIFEVCIHHKSTSSDLFCHF
jgi:hypothetical protein